MNQNSNNKNRNGKYVTGIVSFVLVVAVFAGIGLFGSTGKKKENTPAPEVKTEQQKAAPKPANEPKRPSAILPEELETENVDANKNAEPQKTAQAETKKADPKPQEEKKEVSSNQTAEAEATERTAQNPPVSEYAEEEEMEAAGNFINGDRLSWPIEGNIVMDYSIDKAIYDVTLEQYRTNDSVCIQAAEGTEVKASADGTVAYVGLDSEKGNTIVIEHKDGWATTYSQLADDISVKEGQNVAAGQVIGTVGAPSKYSVLLGSHLDFQVSRDDQSMDPKVALSE